MVERLCKYDYGNQYGETHQQSPEHVVNEKMPPAITECGRDIWTHLPVDMCFTGQTGEKSCQYQEHIEKALKHKKCWKDFTYSELLCMHKSPPMRQKPYENNHDYEGTYTEEKSYICKQCGKAWSDSCSLL